MTANYMVITSAACEPAYLQEALGHVGTFVGELIDKAGCVGARYGVVATGMEAGNLALFQSYAGLGDLEKVFEVYSSSAAYQSVINSGKVSVAFRNIVKLEDVGLSDPSAGMPKYGVVTLMDGAAVTADRASGFTPIFKDNGAMLMRFGALLTGPNAGKKVLAVTYPSMDAIEKTYDALRASADYQSLIRDIRVERREIVRIVG